MTVNQLWPVNRIGRWKCQPRKLPGWPVSGGRQQPGQRGQDR